MMDVARLRELLDAHGAELSAWPQTDRAAAERLLAVDPRAAACLAEARELERSIRAALRQTDRDPAEAAAARRVLAALASQPLPPQRRLGSRWHWPAALLEVDFAPAWARLAALTSTAVLGIAIGLLVSDVAANVTTTDLGSVVFDPEPLTGVGP
jgi:anti-sigma factor RsiW